VSEPAVSMWLSNMADIDRVLAGESAGPVEVQWTDAAGAPVALPCPVIVERLADTDAAAGRETTIAVLTVVGSNLHGAPKDMGANDDNRL